jgi:hypothetical protein
VYDIFLTTGPADLCIIAPESESTQQNKESVMNQVFDLVEEINEKVTEYFYSTGLKPSTLEISPCSYRQLIEMESSEHAIGDLIIGCKALREMTTALGKLHVVINETIADTELALA